MEALPPGALILMVAALSVSAGALLTWLIIYISREQGSAPQDTPRDEEPSTDVLLRVVRTKGGASVFVRGRRLRHLREIKDRDTGQETILAVKAVLRFAEGWLPALREEERPPSSADAQPAAGVAASARPIGQRAPLAGQRTEGIPSAEPLKLVEEINVLIQKRLHGRPELAKRGIRLSRDIDGRPLIYVGQHTYRSAEEIPNREVSTFIRETIQMWERQ